ncbi:MAG: hypothetical protein MJZ41_15715 [Bacteroidaceae bacterium]|nr:hypothetical protein [Bacteroidaceae bacterium]
MTITSPGVGGGYNPGWDIDAKERGFFDDFTLDEGNPNKDFGKLSLWEGIK